MRLALSFFLLVTSLLTVAAQVPDKSSATVSQLGKFVLPKAGAGLEGTIVVAVEVDASGTVTSVTSVLGPGPICPQVTRSDVAAVRIAASVAAQSTKFTPATVAGKPVPSNGTIRFELPGQETRDAEHYAASTRSEGVNKASSKTISGHVVEGIAGSLPKPPYPPAARAVRAMGPVEVQVLIDEEGSVFSAYAVSGHPLLRVSSVTAACKAKFRPTLLSGQPVKVSGIVTYNFVP